MKKLDNFINCLTILANADFKMAETNDIYRTGVIGQFNLTFELAWKALQEIMRKHGVEDSSTGSPREILQLGYKFGFINNSETWLLMLKKRNTDDYTWWIYGNRWSSWHDTCWNYGRNTCRKCFDFNIDAVLWG